MQVKALLFSKKHLQHDTKHVHEIGAKGSQNGAKSGPGAVPETLPKKSSKKLPTVNQKASKVDQKAPTVDQQVPRNDSEKKFKIKKNGSSGLFFHIKKTMIMWKLFFLVFWPPSEVPDLQNPAKTL